MADFTFRISPNVVLGSYTASRLGQFTKEYGSKFMVIIDPILKESGVYEKVTQPLAERGVEYFLFEDIEGVANTKTIENALSLARNAHIQGVIGVGGGKVIQTARAVSALFNEENQIYDILDGTLSAAQPLPLICLLSTIRDPFVFTDRVPLLDSRSRQLVLLKVPNALCRLVMFDPNLTTSLTEKQTFSMAIETLCIAVESYISQKAGFFSDMLAEKAIGLMGLALDGTQSLTVTTPAEVLLAQGGCMASLASACSSLGVASLLAATVNARYGISRSLVTAILFPYIIEDAAKYKTDRLAVAARILKLDTDVDPEEEITDAKCAALLAENVRQRLAKANLPARLKDLGLSIEQLALATEDAGQLEFVNTLPRSMNADDLFALIKAAY